MKNFLPHPSFPLPLFPSPSPSPFIAQALFRHLEWKYDRVPWPSVNLPVTSLLNHFLRRINEASVRQTLSLCFCSFIFHIIQGPYQMFSVLVDVALLRKLVKILSIESGLDYFIP